MLAMSQHPFSYLPVAIAIAVGQIANWCAIYCVVQGAGVHIEVLVGQEDPNVPRYLNAELGSDRRELTFLKFDAVTPPEAMFTVPNACQE